MGKLLTILLLVGVGCSGSNDPIALGPAHQYKISCGTDGLGSAVVQWFTSTNQAGTVYCFGPYTETPDFFTQHTGDVIRMHIDGTTNAGASLLEYTNGVNELDVMDIEVDGLYYPNSDEYVVPQ